MNKFLLAKHIAEHRVQDLLPYGSAKSIVRYGKAKKNVPLLIATQISLDTARQACYIKMQYASLFLRLTTFPKRKLILVRNVRSKADLLTKNTFPNKDLSFRFSKRPFGKELRVENFRFALSENSDTTIDGQFYAEIHTKGGLQKVCVHIFCCQLIIENQ